MSRFWNILCFKRPVSGTFHIFWTSHFWNISSFELHFSETLFEHLTPLLLCPITIPMYFSLDSILKGLWNTKIFKTCNFNDILLLHSSFNIQSKQECIRLKFTLFFKFDQKFFGKFFSILHYTYCIAPSILSVNKNT